MRKSVSLLLAASLILSCSTFASAKSSEKKTEEDVFPLLEKIEQESAAEDSYSYFLTHSAFEDAVGDDIVITAATEYSDADGTECLDFALEAPKNGRYYLKLEYIVPASGREQIERGIRVNGQTQYRELSEFILEREYYDDGEPKKDFGGNEIRPEQKQSEAPVTNYIYDYSYSYNVPLSVNLNAGKNIVTVYKLAGEVKLQKLILEPAGNVKSYAELKDERKAAGVSEAGGSVTVEAEKCLAKSSTTIYPISDRTSAATSPSQAGKIMLNTIGASHWSIAGQYIKWNVKVDKSGLYKISLRFRQNSSPGQASTRTVYINNKLQFKEATEITFGFDSSWQSANLGGGEDYLFYLDAGDNEIKMRATPGRLDTVLRVLDGCVDGFNAIYRKLLMTIGATPDLLRDYRLDLLYPEQIAAFGTYADKLTVCADFIEQYCGKGNAGAALIKSFIRQLEKMNKDPDTVPSEFSYFKSNIGSLSTWIASATEQPLEIDLLVIGDGKELPKVSAGFFKQLAFSVGEYLSSYMTDYELIGAAEVTDNKDAITVWVGTGRDQAQIVRNLSAKSFTPKSGIATAVKNVDAGSLMSAVVAGMGPDVVALSSPDVFNYAMREAAYPLSGFKDIDSVTSRFPESSLITLRYRDKLYGLPEAIAFDMMFYRTDILEELGVSVPETWDDLIEISSVLANNNMEIGVSSDANTFLTMLMQAGIDIYAEGGMYTTFDSVAAINVFNKFTNLYVSYGFPLTFEFQNRFRSGEMPIGIASFGLYNTLQIAAPEINGLWKMVEIPGTVREDGSVNRTALASSSAVMILADTDKPDESWEFVKWWTDTDAQTDFADEVESILGKSARYNSANNEAFENSNWSSKEKAIINAQKANTTAVAPMPGGYYLARNLNNAFRNVVYKGASATDALYEYTYKINSEFTKKRKEFGLPTLEDKEVK